MKVFVTGGTGFVGKAVVQRLLQDGHTVSVLTRSPERARALLGVDPKIVSAKNEGWASKIEGHDAVVNLAGEGIFDARWTDARKAKLVSSRLDTTNAIVEAIGALPPEKRPKSLISTSAVGYYGDVKNAACTEERAPATDFLAQLCVDWEGAATRAEEYGVRVVLPRVAIVLGEGGALQKMLPPFLAGAGGTLGFGGKQWMSWIHLDDLAEIYVEAATNTSWRGPVNASSPNPATNAEFTRALGKVLNRPTLIPVPGIALRLLLGESASALLGGQKVIPKQAEGWGFAFKYADVHQALADILKRPVVELERHAGEYHLRQRTVFEGDLPKVFEFFSKAENLGALTPPWVKFKILEKPKAMVPGAEIGYSISIGPLPMKWRSLIDEFEAGSHFIDTQLIGPYKSWWHQHKFYEEDGKVVMEDNIRYTMPFSFLGRIANFFGTRHILKRVFGYRADVMRRRFKVTSQKVLPRATSDVTTKRKPSPNPATA